MKTNRNQLVLPFNYEAIIDENDPVWKLVEICDTLDYSKLYDTYLRHWRIIDPVVMFEILVFAYMNGIYSSRKIEQACKTDIRFMWLLQNQAAPDHATIARFQNERLADVIEDLFYQIIMKLYELGEVKFRNLFVDGTKIEANANRYTFVWAKTIEKNLQKLNAKINQELPEFCEKYGLSETASLIDVVEFLLQTRNILGIKFVYGKGKRKTDLQRDYDRLYKYLERINRYHESQVILGTRKSYSKTDLDATFMRMKEDHMRNGQLKPGYNVQIGVESEYIVGIGLFSNPTDTTTLIPFLERIRENTGKKYLNIIADAGYASEENYSYLEENEQNAYIKPADYEKRKTKKYRDNIYRIENLSYDEINDCFTCPNGKRLNHAYDGKRKTENQYEVIKSYYICESCKGCPHREKCYKGKYENRKISFSKTMARQKAEATERITTEDGITLRQNRSIQVEGAFGVIKQDRDFRRFLTRGKVKTETQFFLLAFAFNINKLHNRTIDKRLGIDLFKQEAV